jgi:hypothetical protein
MGFLDILALLLLMLSITAVFFLFIYIHDLPYKIAKEREHPHSEAIGVAQWLALFTLEALWPLVFMWAVSHKKPPQQTPPLLPQGEAEADITQRLVILEERLRKLESGQK